MSSYISCYNQETRELEHYKVPYDVSVYVRQLENEIKYASGGVKRLYPFRFKKRDIEDWYNDRHLTTN